MKPILFSSVDLGLLREQLDLWRGRQTGRHRLPPELWEAAGRLAVAQGVSRVARTLRVDFHRVRRECRPPPVPVDPIPTRFVELERDRPSPGAVSGWVELSDGSARRMRLQTGPDPAAWVALARAFWENTP